MAVKAASRSAFEMPRLARMSAAVPAGAVWILREVVRRRGLAVAFLADFFAVRLEWFVLLLGIPVPQSRSLMWLHSSALSARVKGTLAARGRLTGSGFAPSPLRVRRRAWRPVPWGHPPLALCRERRGVETEAKRRGLYRVVRPPRHAGRGHSW